jgi:hypothetical protein
MRNCASFAATAKVGKVQLNLFLAPRSVNNELQSICQGAVLALSNIFLEGLRKTTQNVRIVGILVEIRNEDLQNTSLERYRCSNLVCIRCIKKAKWFKQYTSKKSYHTADHKLQTVNAV